MKASYADGGDFEITPAGNHVCRPYSLVDIGMQETNYGMKHQIIVGFELSNELMEDGRPFSINKWYTLSLNPKATLCKDIESMYGKTMSDKAKASFEFDKILGHPCMINVVHEEKDGKTKAKATSLSPLPKGTKAPELHNNVVFFDLENPDWDLYDNLPDWQKERVNKESFAEVSKPEEVRDPLEDFDDDIPF